VPRSNIVEFKFLKILTEVSKIFLNIGLKPLPSIKKELAWLWFLKVMN